MTREEFLAWADRLGWIQDKFGHYRKDWEGHQYRIRIGGEMLIYEVKMDKRWMFLSSALISSLYLEGDILTGLVVKI